MGDRYWLWVVVRLMIGVAIVGWAFSYLGTGSGEKEFQKSLDAMKQVRSFRATFAANPATQEHEMLWEVDCARDIVHWKEHFADTGRNPPAELDRDEVFIGGRDFHRASDGSWTQQGSPYMTTTAHWYCTNLAQGTDTNVLPRIATMIKRGILQKGDKKTVNGVRCREWLVTLKGGTSGLEHDTVCLGLDDHLPYELTVDWEHSRSSFSDYNTSIQFDLPEAALQPTATAGSN
ncbi:MAG TPA: hypothetical protein VMG31_09275 [Verrucomicrobiae bacterium]|nr:hypothetical protein [Verrucomicrobiae bacterium]